MNSNPKLDTPLHSSPKRASYTIPALAYALSCLVFASSPAAIKTALDYYTPSVLLFWCMFLAALTILPFAIRSLKSIKINTKKEALLLFLMILCDPIAYFGFEALSLQYASASQASMAGASSPVIITFFAWIFLKERFSKIVWVGLAITVVGIMVLTGYSETASNATNPVLGTLFMILSKCGSGFFIIIMRHFEGRFPLSAIVCTQFLVASLFFSPAVIAEPNFGLCLELIPLALIFYQGAAVTLGGQMLSAYAVSYTPSHIIGIITPLYPILAVLFSMALLGEKLVLLQWGAFAFILIGMLICQKFREIKH